jgi:molybdate transport system ATP-binding protein
LSGGERQRVAIGRALLSRPKLLLMDEPLSALDGPAKDDILAALEQLQRSLPIPTLYVTHDMREVERLADTLVLMEAGRVRAVGPLAQLQSDPALPLAALRDASVSLDATVVAYDAADGLATLAVPGGRFFLPTPAMPVGEMRRLRIAALDVSLALAPFRESTILNVLPARILTHQPSGDYEMTAVLGLGPDGGGARLLSRVTRRSWQALGLADGQVIHAQIKGAALAPRR